MICYLPLVIDGAAQAKPAHAAGLPVQISVPIPGRRRQPVVKTRQQIVAGAGLQARASRAHFALLQVRPAQMSWTMRKVGFFWNRLKMSHG